jgi:acyl carrier protein
MEKIQKMLAERLNVESIDPKKELTALGLDSLDVVEMLLDLEEEFGVQFQSEEMKNYRTVEDLYNAINEKLENK